MGLGGEASYLRHEAERNQKDPDNGKITMVITIISAIVTLCCIVGCIRDDVENQEAAIPTERTEEIKQVDPWDEELVEDMAEDYFNELGEEYYMKEAPY